MTGDLAERPPRSFAFGPFVLIPERQLLLQGEAPVRIGGRALDILTALVERPGEVVSKRELTARVWPNFTVEESNLKVNVAALRRALGQRPDSAQFIATVVGRGYRFIAPVQSAETGASSVETRAATPRSHNLPTGTTRIIGREEAIEGIRRDLGEARLVSIVGAGGIGKTTVALAVAEHAVGSSREGVWLVDMAPLKDPSLIPNAIATAINLTAQSADMLAALSGFLRDREMLLVLDSCEHIIDAVAPCAARLLADAPGVKILATSREPLRIKGERVRRLPGLATPPSSSRLSAQETLAFPAVRLFVDRATDTLESFKLSDADAPIAAEICRRLDGLPLAIELAATRVDAFGVSGLLEQLDDRIRLLMERRAGPERHQTLMATIDWSYDLLSESERRLLRRLSVFRGSFSLESACALAADEDTDGTKLPENLANLVAKSLVAVEATGGTTHYRLLDTTRHYAFMKLTENDELERLRLRHVEHLRDLAERAEAEWETRPTSEWLARYGRTVDDIRSALSWAFAENRDISIGVALTVAAIPFWEHMSLVEECRACVERALQRSKDGSLRDRDEMKLCTALGTTLLHTRGPLPKVKLAWTRALELAEQLGDVEYQLRCLWGLCDYHTWTGDHQTALTITYEIRAVAVDKGDFAASINVDRQTGTALRYLGEFAEARRCLERMISRYVPPVVRADTARFQLDPRLAARGTLANVLWLQGYPDQAVRMARQQLEDAEAAEHALALCNALVHAACPIALYVGDMAAAERLLTRIQNHVTEHAMTVWSAMAQCLRGEWFLKRGDASGLTILQGALGELSDAGFRMRYPAHLGIFAEGLAVYGDLDAASVAIDEAITLAARSGEFWCMPELLRIKGRVLSFTCSAGATSAVEDQYLQALELARRQGALSWELRAVISLAEFWGQRGEGERAEDFLSSTYSRFEEGFETRDVQNARSLLDDMTSSIAMR